MEEEEHILEASRDEKELGDHCDEFEVCVGFQDYSKSCHHVPAHAQHSGAFQEY